MASLRINKNIDLWFCVFISKTKIVTCIYICAAAVLFYMTISEWLAQWRLQCPVGFSSHFYRSKTLQITTTESHGWCLLASVATWWPFTDSAKAQKRPHDCISIALTSSRNPDDSPIKGPPFLHNTVSVLVSVHLTWERQLESTQPCSSSKHVSHTRTAFLEDGVMAFLDEHSAQKMFPQCLQWCCRNITIRQTSWYEKAFIVRGIHLTARLLLWLKFEVAHNRH